MTTEQLAEARNKVLDDWVRELAKEPRDISPDLLRLSLYLSRNEFASEMPVALRRAQEALDAAVEAQNPGYLGVKRGG